MKHITLFIDASDQEKVKLTFGDHLHVFKATRDLSERLIPEIQKFLKKQKLEFKQIKKITVNSGPGHFSRIRTAVAMANALAFALNLPQKMIKPIYDQPPNISRSSKKY